LTFGWSGKTIYVDLLRAKISIKPLDVNLARNYIGGRGINSRMLYDMVGPNVDALSPENVLLIATAGP
jgi:aldehyde:ferredoxin oxidoreductase